MKSRPPPVVPIAGRYAVIAHHDLVAALQLQGGRQAVADGKAEPFFEDAKATSNNGVQLLRRSCQIANMTEWKEPEASALKRLIATLGEAAWTNVDVRGFMNVGELDADYRITESATMAKRAEVLATTPELHADTAREMWELAARAHYQNGADADRNPCLTCAAECYVRMAEASGAQALLEFANMERSLSPDRLREEALKAAEGNLSFLQRSHN